MDFISPILVSAVGAGIAAGCIAYSQYVKQHGSEDFDKIKFAKTLLLAVGVGAFGSYYGLAESVIIGSPMYAAVAQVLENIIKYVARYGN